MAQFGLGVAAYNLVVVTVFEIFLALRFCAHYLHVF